MTFFDPLALVLAVAAAQTTLPAPQRARDPWVFRSVLDGAPRRITLALDQDMWVAYDAETCGLYKAWKGSVLFEGAVYDTRHGPQPKSVGSTYIDGVPGSVWTVEVDGVEVPVRARYRGYEFHGERVMLQYELSLADGRVLRVREMPEFVKPEHLFQADQRDELDLVEGHPGLFRRFIFVEPPPGVVVRVELRTDGISGKLAEGMDRERFLDVTDDRGRVTTQCRSHLVLSAERPMNHLVLFFEPRPDPPTPSSAERSQDPDSGERER